MKVFVDDKEYEKRLAICNACDKFDVSIKRCERCGCFMKLKAKLPKATCPDKKW